MMIIHVAGNDIPLKTTLRTTMSIEQKFKIPMAQLFVKLGEAHAGELIDILLLASELGLAEKNSVRESLIDTWDYLDLYDAVQELVVKLMFAGSPEQNEAKIDKFPGDETAKNAMRARLGLPARQTRTSIGSES